MFWSITYQARRDLALDDEASEPLCWEGAAALVLIEKSVSFIQKHRFLVVFWGESCFFGGVLHVFCLSISQIDVFLEIVIK